MFQNLFERYGEMQSRRHDDEAPEQGFTLIELLIVIVVLGILAAIVIFSLSGVTGQSAVAACNSDAKTVQTAVAAYNAQAATPLVALDNTGTAQDGSTPLTPTYLHTWPAGSSSAKSYELQYTGGSNGEVQVSTDGGTTWANYDSSPNPCSAA